MTSRILLSLMATTLFLLAGIIWVLLLLTGKVHL